MKPTIRMLLVLTVAVVPATANATGYGEYQGHVVGPFVELTAEERAWFRDQVKVLPAETREAMRRRMREEWQEVPPEERQRRRSEWAEERDDRHSGGDAAERGFGKGYEVRQGEHTERRGRGRR